MSLGAEIYRQQKLLPMSNFCHHLYLFSCAALYPLSIDSSILIMVPSSFERLTRSIFETPTGLDAVHLEEGWPRYKLR